MNAIVNECKCCKNTSYLFRTSSVITILKCTVFYKQSRYVGESRTANRQLRFKTTIRLIYNVPEKHCKPMFVELDGKNISSISVCPFYSTPNSSNSLKRFHNYYSWPTYKKDKMLHLNVYLSIHIILLLVREYSNLFHCILQTTEMFLPKEG